MRFRILPWRVWYFTGAAGFLCILMLCYFLYYLTGRFSERYPDLYLPACVCVAAAGALLEVKNPDFPFLYSVNGEGYMNFFVGALLAEVLMNFAVYFVFLILLSILSWYYLEKKNRLWDLWQAGDTKNVT